MLFLSQKKNKKQNDDRRNCSLEICAVATPEPSWRCSLLMSTKQALRPQAPPAFTQPTLLTDSKGAQNQHQDRAGPRDGEMTNKRHLRNRDCSVSLLPLLLLLPAPPSHLLSPLPSPAHLCLLEEVYSKTCVHCLSVCSPTHRHTRTIIQ